MKHFQCNMFLRRNSNFLILTWVSLEESKWGTEHLPKASFFYLKWQIVVKALHWESEGYWFKPNNVHNRAWAHKFVTRLLIDFYLKKCQSQWLILGYWGCSLDSRPKLTVGQPFRIKIQRKHFSRHQDVCLSSVYMIHIMLFFIKGLFQLSRKKQLTHHIS